MKEICLTFRFFFLEVQTYYLLKGKKSKYVSILFKYRLNDLTSNVFGVDPGQFSTFVHHTEYSEYTLTR